MLAQIESINNCLESKVPGYKTIRQSTVNIYGKCATKAEVTLTFVQAVVESASNLAVSYHNGLVKKVSYNIDQYTNQFLTKIEQMLKVQKKELIEGESDVEQKTLERVKKIVIRVNKLLFICGDNIREYGMEMLQAGRKMGGTFYLPIYISLKATVLVTRQMMIEVLQKRLNTMKVTYQASKGTVTMIVTGKFNQEKIKEAISQGMRTFKQMTVKVVQKGLQIKVDRQSLLQNYDTFCLKFMEVIKNMKEIGNQNIVSIKQSSLDLYREVINRIKEKQILIKSQYQNRRQITEEKLTTTSE